MINMGQHPLLCKCEMIDWSCKERNLNRVKPHSDAICNCTFSLQCNNGGEYGHATSPPFAIP